MSLSSLLSITLRMSTRLFGNVRRLSNSRVRIAVQIRAYVRTCLSSTSSAGIGKTLLPAIAAQTTVANRFAWYSIVT